MATELRTMGNTAITAVSYGHGLGRDGGASSQLPLRLVTEASFVAVTDMDSYRELSRGRGLLYGIVRWTLGR